MPFALDSWRLFGLSAATDSLLWSYPPLRLWVPCVVAGSFVMRKPASGPTAWMTSRHTPFSEVSAGSQSAGRPRHSCQCSGPSPTRPTSRPMSWWMCRTTWTPPSIRASPPSTTGQTAVRICRLCGGTPSRGALLARRAFLLLPPSFPSSLVHLFHLLPSSRWRHGADLPLLPPTVLSPALTDLPFVGYTYKRFDYLTRRNAI